MDHSGRGSTGAKVRMGRIDIGGGKGRGKLPGRGGGHRESAKPRGRHQNERLRWELKGGWREGGFDGISIRELGNLGMTDCLLGKEVGESRFLECAPTRGQHRRDAVCVCHVFGRQTSVDSMLGRSRLGGISARFRLDPTPLYRII